MCLDIEMPRTAQTGDLGPPFQRPTSVLLHGVSEALLEWVALAYVSAAPGGYSWSDLRTPGQAPDPLGPIAKRAIPEDHLHVNDPRDFALNDAAANAAITAGLRSDAQSAELSRLVDFMRLPSRTQAAISSRGPAAGPRVLVVSNARQLVPFFTIDTLRMVLQLIRTRGFVVVALFDGVSTQARHAFDCVWRLEGNDPRSWRGARLEVEQSGPFTPLPSGSKASLEQIPLVSLFLSRVIDPWA